MIDFLSYFCFEISDFFYFGVIVLFTVSFSAKLNFPKKIIKFTTEKFGGWRRRASFPKSQKGTTLFLTPFPIWDLIVHKTFYSEMGSIFVCMAITATETLWLNIEEKISYWS